MVDNDGFLFCNRIGFYKKDGKYGVIGDWGAHTEPIFEDVEMEPDGDVKVKYNGEWGFIGEDNKFTTDKMRHITISTLLITAELQ